MHAPEDRTEFARAATHDYAYASWEPELGRICAAERTSAMHAIYDVRDARLASGALVARFSSLGIALPSVNPECPKPHSVWRE